jgi:hypothetical protein
MLRQAELLPQWHATGNEAFALSGVRLHQTLTYRGAFLLTKQ